MQKTSENSHRMIFNILLDGPVSSHLVHASV